MKIPFQKWHGCKNNFIVITASINQTDLIPSLQRQAHNLCNKDGSSIGADGILVLEYPDSLSFQFAPKQVVIINSDGSLAKNCGNGLRCAALACYQRALDNNQDSHIPDSFELFVEEKSFFCRFLESSVEGLPYVSLSMGKPQINESNSWHDEAQTAVKALFKKSSQAPKLEGIHTCTLSNQHIILFVDQLKQDFLKELGHALQKGYSWDGINVHLAQNSSIDPKRIKGPAGVVSRESIVCDVLHWERGCGPTAGCGSGASSIAACLFADGFLSEQDCVVVRMPGGSVFIRQKNEKAPMEMIGPAQFIFDGSLEI